MQKGDLKRSPFFVSSITQAGESNFADSKRCRPNSFIGDAVWILHQAASALKQKLFHVLCAFGKRLRINNIAVLIHQIQNITLHAFPPTIGYLLYNFAL